MKIEESVAQKICGAKPYRRFALTYRRYKRLSKAEKKDFDAYKDNYTPREWRGAFMVMYYQHVPFHHRLFRMVKRLYDLPSIEFMAKYRTVTRLDLFNMPYYKQKYLKKELKFQGFVMDNKFNKNTRFHIESNQKIEGHIYILDKEINEYIEAQNIFSCYGIPGFTKWNWS